MASFAFTPIVIRQFVFVSCILYMWTEFVVVLVCLPHLSSQRECQVRIPEPGILFFIQATWSGPHVEEIDRLLICIRSVLISVVGSRTRKPKVTPWYPPFHIDIDRQGWGISHGSFYDGKSPIMNNILPIYTFICFLLVPYYSMDGMPDFICSIFKCIVLCI